MPLSFEEYKDRMSEIIELRYNSSLAQSTGLMNAWVGGSEVGVAPTTAALCDHTTIGAIGRNDGFRFDEDYYILGFDMVTNTNVSYALIDRLAHSGGLDGTLTSEQTTNLPVGTGITRYDAAADRIQAALQIYGAVGATATTASARYTNSANVANQVSQPALFGSAVANIATRFLELAPADGQKFKTIEGITLAGSTGIVGNFGVVLFTKLIEGYSRTLGHGGHYGFNIQNFYTGDMDLPIARAGACLNLIGKAVPTGGFRSVIRLMRVNP